MIAKNNRQLIFEKNSEKRQRFAIKKLSVGVASVLVGLAIYGGQTAHASTGDASTQATGESQNVTQPQATNSAVKAVALQNVGGGAQASSNDSATNSLASSSPVQGAAVNSAVNTDIPHNNELTPKSGSVNQAEPAKVDNNEDLGKPNKQVIQDNKQDINRVKNKQTVILAAQAASTAPEQTVTTADDFINALKNTNVTTINIGANISLAGKTLETINRDITINGKKDDGSHWGLDFNSIWLTDTNHNVTFENIDLYDNSDNGLVKNAATVNFNNNVSFHGKTLINDGANTVNFNGKVDAQAVSNYKFSNNQVQVTGANNSLALLKVTKTGTTVNFKNGSDVTLSSDHSVVMDFYASTVDEGAKVIINSSFSNINSDQKVHSETSALVAENYSVVVNGNLVINLQAGQGKKVGSVIYFRKSFSSSGSNKSVGIGVGHGHIIVNSNGELSAPLIDLSSHDKNSEQVVIPNSVGYDGTIEVNAQNVGNYTGVIVQGKTATIQAANIKLTADGTGKIYGVDSFRGVGTVQIDVDISKNTNKDSRAIVNLAIAGTHGETKWLPDNQQAQAAPWKDMAISFGDSTKGGPITIVKLDEYNQQIQLADAYKNRVYIKFVDTPNVVQVTAADFNLDTGKVIGTIDINPVINTSIADAYINVKIGSNNDSLNTQTVENSHYIISNNGTPVAQNTKYAIKPDANKNFELDLSNYEDKIGPNSPIIIEVMKEGYSQTVAISFNDIQKEAQAEIEKAKQAAEEKIKGLPLTSDDLQTEKDKIEKDAKAAIDKITSATTVSDIKQVKNDGLKNIATDEAKAQAIAKVDQEVAKVKKDIENLSPDVKAQANKDIDADAMNAKNNIQAANDQAGITKAQNDGIIKIDRDGAIASIEDAAKKANTAIDADPTLANDQQVKDMAHEKVKQDKEAAEALVNQDSTEEQIQKDATEGIKKINRELAKAEIEHEAAKIKAEINKDQYLTSEEQKQAVAEVDQKVKKAEQNIDEAPDNDIEDAKNKGIVDIDKTGAEAAVRNETKKIEQSIKADDFLPQVEKDKYLHQTETDKDNALNKIAASNTVDEVESAKNNGLNQIDRDGAKAAIDNEARKITQLIDGLQHVDGKTKQAADEQVEKDRQFYINKLNDPSQTTTQVDIERIKKEGIKKIDDDGNLAIAKDQQAANAGKHQGDDNTPTSANQTQEMINDQGSSETGMTNGQQRTIGHEQKLASANEQINVANKNHYPENRLPQTGSQDNRTVETIGLAIATAGIMFGIGTRKKKR